MGLVNERYFLLLSFMAVLFIASCAAPVGDQPGGDNDQPDKPKITSTISPARDITGQWEGRVTFTDRIFSCVYKGDMILNIGQNGKKLKFFMFDIQKFAARHRKCRKRAKMNRTRERSENSFCDLAGWVSGLGGMCA